MIECKECNGSGFVEFKLNPSFVDGSIKTGKIKCQCAKADFDITKHEWDDEDIKLDADPISSSVDFLIAQNEDGQMYLLKSDAIALAKHFKLTPGDLT